MQLRMKDQPLDVVAREIARARHLCDAVSAQLVVNDFWHLAIDAGCDFVHLGQGDLDTADVKALRRAGIKLGISTHSDAELARALEIEPDYVALGPIYPTMLKAMPFAPQGLARIAEWKRAIGSLPLVAIGGITLERVRGVLDAGADSVAVVSDILRHATPEERARDWVSATRD